MDALHQCTVYSSAWNGPGRDVPRDLLLAAVLASAAWITACGAAPIGEVDEGHDAPTLPASAQSAAPADRALATDGGGAAGPEDTTGDAAVGAGQAGQASQPMTTGSVTASAADAGSSPRQGTPVDPTPAREELDAGSSLPACSGCPGETRDQTDRAVHLHHVHLNVRSREASAQFYETYFKAERVLLNGTTEALRVAPTLLLLDERASPPDGSLPTALQHVGWGAADPATWYETAHAQGVQPDTRGFTLFNTQETPTIGEAGSGLIVALSGDIPACFPIPDVVSYMYVLGPDQERIEVWSGTDGRVNHVHFTTADLVATSAWFQQLLGLPSVTPLLSYQFFLDDILFYFEPIGTAADYSPTDDHTLAHVAFAVADLDGFRERVQQQSIEVVAEPALAHGFRSFFVRGPDGLLIELVEAAKDAKLCPE